MTQVLANGGALVHATELHHGVELALVGIRVQVLSLERSLAQAALVPANVDCMAKTPQSRPLPLLKQLQARPQKESLVHSLTRLPREVVSL